MATTMDVAPRPERTGLAELRTELVQLYPYWVRRAPNAEQLAELTERARRTGTVERLHVFRRRQEGWRYYVLRGDLQLMAARTAGLTTIPVEFKVVGSEEEGEKLWLLDRLRQERMAPVERAEAYQRLVRLGAKPSAFAGDAATTKSGVSSSKRLLKLPAEVLWLLESEALTEHHAKIIALYAPWPKLLVWLATATVVNGWSSARLERERPVRYGLTKGVPEPAEVPEPGTPPFGAAWRRGPLRRWVAEQMERWIGQPGMDAAGVARQAAQFVTYAGVPAALEVVGWLAEAREEEAMALGGEVEEELTIRREMREEGWRIGKVGTEEEERREAVRLVWERWLKSVAEEDLMLAWRIGKECFVRFEPLEEEPRWPPAGIVRPLGG